MPSGLRRFQESKQTHFVTFSCYRRQPKFDSSEIRDLFLLVLEDMREHFSMRVYGYVVMPEHVHLLVSEPDRGLMADAMHYLKLSFAKRLRGAVIARPRLASNERTRTWGTPVSLPADNSFWQKRYHDRNVRDEHEFVVKLRYLHRNPVKRGLVKKPQEWGWSSFVTMHSESTES
jgi:putative transposase